MKPVRFATSADGSPVLIDVPRLVESRLLVQASSGGGKSYAIRKLLEVTHGHVQHLVIDPDGEFSSLRQKYEYLQVGKEGDVPADPRTAELLAEKLLTLGIDAIVDLYELKPQDRKRFVRLFTEAIVNAPKSLWHPVLVIVDEAHVFCPEKGEGESEAMGAVIDLASRGRKREFALTLATQRIPKLNKNATAECQNKLIGLANQDLDRKRAGDELGFRTKEDFLTLRDLEPGQMYVLGPAFQIGGKRVKDPVIVQVDQVVTPHGKKAKRWSGRRTAPTSKIKKALAQLADLPEQSEELARDRASLVTRIRDLEHELREAKRGVPKSDPQQVEKAELAGFQRGRKEVERLMRTTHQFKNKLLQKLKEIGALVEELPTDAPTNAPPAKVHALPAAPPRAPIPLRARREPAPVLAGADKPLGKCERAILNLLVNKPGETFTKAQLGGWTEYSVTSSSFANALGALRSAGLIHGSGDQISLGASTADAIAALGSSYDPNFAPSIEGWKQKLPKASREIFSVLLEAAGEPLSKEELSSSTGYSLTSSSFANALGDLCSKKLAQRIAGGVRLNPELLEGGR